MRCHIRRLSWLLVPLLLTDEDQADLVAFLRSLTGDPPPAELGKDTSSTDP